MTEPRARMSNVIPLHKRSGKPAQRHEQPAQVTMFPILKSKHWRNVERDILRIAADNKGASISNTLTAINRADYMDMGLPVEILQREFTRVGIYMLGKANTIRHMAKMPEVKVRMVERPVA